MVFDVGEAASEYLVVPASSVNENGNECDKAGVGFAAFAGQPDRCGHVRGTCLKNQPQAYRRHDAVRMTGAINETTLEIACPRAAGVASCRAKRRETH